MEISVPGRLFAGWSVLMVLCAILSVCQSIPAWGQVDGGSKIPREIIDGVLSGIPQDVIIVFDDSDVQTEVLGVRRQEGRAFDSPGILRLKAEGFGRLKNGIDEGFSSGDFELLRDYANLPMMAVRLVSPTAITRLADDKAVIRVFPNLKRVHFLSESLPLMSQPEVRRTYGLIGTGTTVAIIDTGVDYSQRVFGSCKAPGTGCRVIFARDFTYSDDGQRDVAPYHGSHVAAIVLGVAPGAKIAALDVFSGEGAWDQDIAAAIDWCIENREMYNIVAMNLSLGSGGFETECPEDSLAQAIRHAKDAGILAVVASGNDGYLDRISSPACAPGVVSVGAVYDSNVGRHISTSCSDTVTRTDMVTCFSNSGPHLSLLAPGSVITALGNSMSGTSQAAPHVAGAIAVLRGEGGFPWEDPDTTAQRLTSTGVPVVDTRNNLTKPRLDLHNAVTSGYGYSVSGLISSNGRPLGGAAVRLSGSNITSEYATKDDGAFLFLGLPPGIYTITPIKDGYVFLPGSQKIELTDSGIESVNFNAVRTVFSISGAIMSARSQPSFSPLLDGIQVFVTGEETFSGYTDRSGNYRIDGITPGSYTIYPFSSRFGFSPHSRQVIIDKEDLVRQDFSAIVDENGRVPVKP